MIRRIWGTNNHAGALVPQTSPWGQALARGTPQLIEQPVPIGTRPHNFGGTVGGLETVSANTRALVSPPGYFGDLPQDEQGTVFAPPPWSRV